MTKRLEHYLRVLLDDGSSTNEKEKAHQELALALKEASSWRLVIDEGLTDLGELLSEIDEKDRVLESTRVARRHCIDHLTKTLADKPETKPRKTGDDAIEQILTDEIRTRGPEGMTLKDAFCLPRAIEERWKAENTRRRWNDLTKRDWVFSVGEPKEKRLVHISFAQDRPDEYSEAISRSLK